MIVRNKLSKKQTSVLGILGGMGPMTHIKFEEALIAECNRRGAKTDQDYPVWFVISGTSTPDRTKSLKGGTSALKHLLYFSKNLERQGADFIVMTCNTAHAYKKEIEKCIHIPVISLIDEAAKYVKNNYPSVKKVGVLATDGTLKANLYQEALRKMGIQQVTPLNHPDIQQSVMEVIYNREYGIKSTGTELSTTALDNLDKAVTWCTENGAELIIAGCTEISLGLANRRFKTLTVADPLHILARIAIKKAFARKRSTKVIKSPKSNQKSDVEYRDYDLLSI